MRVKKLLKYFLLFVLLVIVTGLAWVILNVFPVVSGYGSKNLCSAVYLQHRNPKDVIREDLGSFPLSLGSFKVDQKDSSVTGSVWGLARSKTIYRTGCGCTLVREIPEAEVRSRPFTIPAKPPGNRDRISWPEGDKLADTISTAIDQSKLQQAVTNCFKVAGLKEKQAFTRAVLVLYDGNIVAEQYAPGFDRNTVQLGWSVSKTLTSALLGILVKQGRLTVSQPAPVPGWAETKKSTITIRNLLQQNTGIDFTEIYTRPSSVTTMLFRKGDMAKYAASLSYKYAPGAVFNYSSGNTNILSGIIRRTIGEKDYSAFPYTQLFYRINAYSFLLEPDASGTFIGSSYSYATARDFARFGLLYYRNGNWNGDQVLPENWVHESVQPVPGDPQKHYGYQLWLNGYDAKDPTKRLYPDVPADMYFFDGYGGQDIYIIPSKKLVVVRLGLYNIDENRFLKEVISAVRD